MNITRADRTRAAGILFSNSRQRAARKGIAFNLTEDYIFELVAQAVTTDRCNLETHSHLKASLDRIDSDGGYVIGNVQIIPAWLNYAYGRWPKSLIDKAILTEAGK